MLGGIGMNNKAEYTPEKVVDISNLSREDWLPLIYIGYSRYGLKKK